ncbi:MAG: APC family permease [candidate division Zixibacteria bacterium]|nr:APC family permease [candidate division Zixibacteria bacterium]
MSADTDTDRFWWQKLYRFLIGGSRDLRDTGLFHKLSLTAFFAWIALGSDGLSSSSYGPQEAFVALHGHTSLAIFVAIASALTILVISASYSQIIELFPSGGGGYVVSSKLLSPGLGMIAGCALIIDYVLTITVSIASGADAIFSFVPPEWHQYKLVFAGATLALLIVLNLRGIRESATALMPIFLIFVASHAIAIGYAIFSHLYRLPEVTAEISNDVSTLSSQIGMWGVFVIVLRAYSMGAGTYTGIEAVSNGLQALREPRAETGKRTMRYVAISLAVTVVGLVLAYLLFGVKLQEGKTLNASLFEAMTTAWPGWMGQTFVVVTLLSEAALLFVAAETGLLGGPAVLSNMALDKWFPTRFAILSDRFVSQNGILFMGFAALVMLILSHGSVTFLVVLYSINVFITFVLSQLGMVRHWLTVRRKVADWRKRFSINLTGLILCSVILVAVILVKFEEGAWLTFIITGALVLTAILIRRHYRRTSILLKRLDSLVEVVRATGKVKTTGGMEDIEAVVPNPKFDPRGKTAVMTVSGFNGTGLHTLLNIRRVFGETFRNFVFIHVGVVDAGNFKGSAELQNLERHVERENLLYVEFMRREGFYAVGMRTIGTDVIDGVMDLAPTIFQKYPNAVFFGGQIVFPEETLITRFLHNYIVFAIQRRFYHRGLPFIIMPIRV